MDLPAWRKRVRQLNGYSVWVEVAAILLVVALLGAIWTDSLPHRKGISMALAFLLFLVGVVRIWVRNEHRELWGGG